MEHSTSIPLTPEMQAEVAKAVAAQLRGEPGELRFSIQVKKADGRIENHELIGTIGGADVPEGQHGCHPLDGGA